MMQRVQTIYLSLTILFTILFLAGKMLVFTNETGVVQQGIIMPLAILLILVAAISLVAIFFFKKRKIQVKLVIAVIILSVILIMAIVFYILFLSGKLNAEIQPTLNLVFPVLILVFSILAYRGIKKDEELVKSYDRLR